MSVRPKFYTYTETAERLGMTAEQLHRFLAYPQKDQHLRAFIGLGANEEGQRPLDKPLVAEAERPGDWEVSDEYGSIGQFPPALIEQGWAEGWRHYFLTGVFELVGYSKRIRDGERLYVALISDAKCCFKLPDRWAATNGAPHTWLFMVEDVERLATGADQATHGKWPWGDHETDLLRHLREAARKFWINYDPKQPDTAPTNDEVVAWLKDRGVSDRTAEIMATILRADGLRTGPRK